MADEISMRKALEEMVHSSKLYITPSEAAAVLGSSAQDIRVAARQRPDLIHFPFSFIGSRMKIPRIPFLEFLIGVEKLAEMKENPRTIEISDPIPTREVAEIPQNPAPPFPIAPSNPSAISNSVTDSKWELFFTHTFTQEDGETRWEVSIKGWKNNYDPAHDESIDKL